MKCKRCGVTVGVSTRELSTDMFHTDDRCADILVIKMKMVRKALEKSEIHLQEWAAAGNVHARRDLRVVRRALRALPKEEY